MTVVTAEAYGLPKQSKTPADWFLGACPKDGNTLLQGRLRRPNPWGPARHTPRRRPEWIALPIPAAARVSRLATRYGVAIAFVSVALCLGGVYAAFSIPSAVFPQTNFPRVVILVDNGVMPADEMMATVTRPIEEAMKDIPGAITVRSTTGRGSAEINVFFNWSVDMVQAELYVLGRLSEIRSDLPATARRGFPADVFRVSHHRRQPDQQLGERSPTSGIRPATI